MTALRSVIFIIAFYSVTALFVIAGLPLLLTPRWVTLCGFKLHARACLWLLRTLVGTTLEVRGTANIPKGAAIIASKHHSAWETFGLVPLLPDPAMVMKAELKLIPFYGWFAMKLRHIFVIRERGPAALRTLIADARARAAAHRQIVIFPEGTRQEVGARPHYKSGVAALYHGLAIPTVPVALNSGCFWPRRGFLRFPGTIVVEFLEPIPPGLDRKPFLETLEARIEQATARLVAESRRPVMPRPDPNLDTIAEHKKNT
jgi:1-acyl-sn-glycerol-3-phosphate acyltransferase